MPVKRNAKRKKRTGPPLMSRPSAYRYYEKAIAPKQNKGRRSKKRKNMPTGPILSALTSKGNPAKKNSTVKMKLHDLRRLISAARTGKRVKVKARVR